MCQIEAGGKKDGEARVDPEIGDELKSQGMIWGCGSCSKLGKRVR